MAYLFGIAIECGRGRAVAVAMENHFSKFEMTLSDGLKATFSSELHELSTPGNSEIVHWVHVFCNEMMDGVENEAIARQLSEVGKALYQQLRTAHSFRFAFVGVEVLEILNFDEIPDLLNDPDDLLLRYAGLVIKQSLTQNSSSEKLFEPFSNGYCWIPYRGESV